MFAIEEGLRKINGEAVETFRREVTETNTALLVEAGTTGYTGTAERKAGGRTYVSVVCECGDFLFSPVRDEANRVIGVEIAACGDAGLDALMKALEFIRQAIGDQRCEVDD